MTTQQKYGTQPAFGGYTYLTCDGEPLAKFAIKEDVEGIVFKLNNFDSCSVQVAETQRKRHEFNLNKMNMTKKNIDLVANLMQLFVAVKNFRDNPIGKNKEAMFALVEE